MQRHCPTRLVPRGRRLLVIVMLLAAAFPLASSISIPVALGEDISDTPLDLPAMALRPADLEAVGIEDAGIWSSILTADEHTAAEFFALWRVDEDDATADAIGYANPELFYAVHLSRSGTQGGIGQTIQPYLMEFRTPGDAEEAFRWLEDGWRTEKMGEVPTAIEIGDEQIAVHGTGRDPEVTTEFERTDILFRDGRIIAGVSVETFTLDHPDQEVVEALAALQAERIEESLGELSPWLSHRVLRMDIPGENAVWDAYSVVEGEALPWYSDTEESFAAFREEVEAAGIINDYRLQQQIVGDGADDAEFPQAYYLVRIVEFDDEDAAAGYLDLVAERLERNNDTAEEVDDVPEIGDEAVAYTYRHERASDGTVFDDYRVYSRVGSMFFTVAINSTEDVDLDAVHDLAEQQAECISDEPCYDPVPVPDELDAAGMLGATSGAAADAGLRLGAAGAPVPAGRRAALPAAR